MASRGPRPVEIVLTAGEREQLGRWARRRRTAAGLATRSRIVLACAAAESNASIARRLEVARPTVARARGRCGAARRGGVLDEPGPGWPRFIERPRQALGREPPAPLG